VMRRAHPGRRHGRPLRAGFGTGRGHSRIERIGALTTTLRANARTGGGT
jgi:hypothetical protein